MACTGTPTIDKSNSEENGTVTSGINVAWAQKFTPASPCISSMSIKVDKILDVGAVVYVTHDVAGLPPIDFLSNNFGSGSKDRSQMPVSPNLGVVSFPLNIELSNLNPVWGVVVPDVYDPNTVDDFYIDVAVGDTGSLQFARKIGAGTWSALPGHLVYSTYKVQSSVCVTPACTVVIQ